MSRNQTSSTPRQSANLTVEEMREGILRLKKRIDAVNGFDPNVPNKAEACKIARTLDTSIEEGLARTFNTDSLDYKRYRDAANFVNPIDWIEERKINEIRISLEKSKSKAIVLLNAAIDALNERIEEAEKNVSIISEIKTEIKPDLSSNRQVFIVHGHDDAIKQSVARFLEQIGFAPIILGEQANQGRTIIEKFEAHTNVEFAVVLLTPDDEGRAMGKELQPRARQNVILELGYFIGKLGRSRVCALRSAGIEIPSDILGVVWTEYDQNGGWRMKLAQELQAAGYKVDGNKVIQR